MATQLQIRRGTTAQMGAFTGAEGELAVNTSTDTVHVHDGSTAGGFALAKADGSNIGTYAGSFTTIAASGTITGNVTGNLTGNVTGNVTGDVTGDLTGSVLTAAQTNITSVGTLSTLAVTGRAVVGGLTSSASILGTSNSNSLGGTTFTSSISTVGLSSSAAITSTSNSNSLGGTSFTSSIDVTGNMIADGVGIGTSSPRSVTNYSVVGINGTSGSAIDFELGEALKTSLTQSAGQFEINVVPALPLIFKTSNTERMRLSGGNLLVGTTSAYTGGKLSVNGGIVQPSGAQNVIGVYGTSGLQMIGVTGGDNVIGTMGANEPLVLRTGSAERMRITSAGDVQLTSAAAVKLGWNRSGAYYNWIESAGVAGNNFMRFGVGNDEKIRLNSAGSLLVGSTSVVSGATKLSVNQSSNGSYSAPLTAFGGDVGYSLMTWLDGTAAYIGQNSTIRALRMFSGSGSAGVNLANAATSWGTFSDERLKENIEPIENALESLSGLRTVKYHLKDVDGSSDKKKLGLIAQDLVGVLDEVIDPLKKQDDDTEYMAVRYTEIIPVLVKAIQEQQATIEALTQRIETLENN